MTQRKRVVDTFLRLSSVREIERQRHVGNDRFYGAERVRGDLRGGAADNVRVQLCRVAVGVLPAGAQLLGRDGGDGARHVLEDHGHRVLRLDGRAAAQLLAGHGGVREERARVRGVRADRGRGAAGPRAARRRLRGRVPVHHRAGQRGAAGARVPRPEPGPVRHHVHGVPVHGQRDHVPGRDAFRGAVPPPDRHVRRREPRPAAAGRRDGRAGPRGGRCHGVPRRLLPARRRGVVRGQRRRSAAHQAPADVRRHARAQRPVRRADGLVAVQSGRHVAVRHLLRGVRLRRRRDPRARVHLHVAAPVLAAVLHDREDGPRHDQRG